jgi:type IV pilus assembly protein PilM
VFRRSKRVVCLDLGSSVVKAVEITLDGQEPVITGFGRAEIAPGGSVAEAVAQVFGQGRFRSKRVVTGVAGQSVVARYVPMMPMSDGELKQAIRYETDKYLPFDIEDVVMDCQALRREEGMPVDVDQPGGGEEQMKVLLAACRKDLLRERLEVVHGQSLTPVAIDLDLFAVANAWELSGLSDSDVLDGEPNRAIALVDIGAVRTSINVLRNGITCFSREINIGGSDMTQAVARRLGVETFEAEAIKRSGEENEVEVNAAITPVLEDLASELSLSVDYVEHHEGVRVEEILFSGGGALAPGAVTYLEQATSRSARTWSPMEGLRVDPSRVDIEELEAWASSLVVAGGLASRVRFE